MSCRPPLDYIPTVPPSIKVANLAPLIRAPKKELGMLDEHLTKIEENLLSTPEFCLLGNRVRADVEKFDWSTLVLGLTTHYILLSEVVYSSNKQQYLGFAGRILKDSAGWNPERCVGKHLDLLDRYSRICVEHMSECDGSFKGSRLLAKLRAVPTDSPARSIFIEFARLVCTSEKELVHERYAHLLQGFSYLKKLRISRDDLIGSMEDSFLTKEKLLRAEETYQCKREAPYTSMIYHIRKVLQPIILNFDDSSLRPNHGPGAVATPGVKGIIAKYRDMSYDSRVDYMLRKSGLDTLEAYGVDTSKEETRAARFICVPKTWKSLRGICAEPSSLMFYQQGVMACILDAVSKSYLSGYLDLSDQSSSMSMALEGSRTGQLATIDLSEASDSVTAQLVRDIFGKSKLCRWLLATRSTSVNLSGSNVKTSRFAPMGSACCFPIECLIFLGICLGTARQKLSPSPLGKLRVYGDDLICPSDLAIPIMDNLDRCGFTVNSAKSYWKGYFRESCGEVAWAGHSIVPIQLKTVLGFYCDRHLNYEGRQQLIDLLNLLEKSGYHRTRSFLLRSSFQRKVRVGRTTYGAQKSLHFSEEGLDNSLRSTQPTNFHLCKKLSASLHRDVYEIVEWVPLFKKEDHHECDDSDDILYRHWLVRFSGNHLPLTLEPRIVVDGQKPLMTTRLRWSSNVGVTRPVQTDLVIRPMKG